MIRGGRGRLSHASAVVVLGVVLGAVLGACVSAPPPAVAPTQSWPEERAQLQALAQFELRGRVAVSAAAEGFNGSLHWKQDHDRTQLEIEGPLGAGAMHVELDGGAISLMTSRTEHLDGDAARTELERRVGFALPLSSLRYWIVGVPDPALPAQEFRTESARLDRLVQSEWQIDYPLYLAKDGLWLPKRLTLQRGSARVRLLIERWGR
jgi:outer membrane lipoprotein LolB